MLLVQVAAKKKAGEDATAEIAAMQAIKVTIDEKEDRLVVVEKLRDATLYKIANILDPSVPVRCVCGTGRMCACGSNGGRACAGGGGGL